MSGDRYIQLTPRGAAQALASPGGGAREHLLQGLLGRAPERPWHSDELGTLAAAPPGEAARTLFTLLREQCITVGLQAPVADDAGWHAVQADVDALQALGAEGAALLDGDGFVLARAGAPDADDGRAPPPTASLTLHVGGGARAARYGLALAALPLEQAWPLVPLARRLLRTRGASA